MARHLLLLSMFLGFLAHAEIPIEDACITEVWSRPRTHLWVEECLPILLDQTDKDKETYALPGIIHNWGSNGLLGAPWHFNDPSCDVFIKSLFETISLASEDILITPHDLFHAHLVSYEHEGAPELALVFHAKEYPLSLSGLKNFYRPLGEEFDVMDKGFQKRNFIFLSHLSTLFRISATGACADWFSGVNYLSEEKLAKVLSQGKLVGDVNYFYAERLKNIKYRFFPGFSSYLSTETDDLEGRLTGKSVPARKVLNEEFDQFLDSLKTPTLLYFMTGVK